MTVDELFEHAPGKWNGTYRLWTYSQDEPDAESPSQLTITSEVDGRSLLARYDWRFGDDGNEGLYLVTRTDEGGIEAGWSDSMHSKSAVMHSAPIDGSTHVLGHFGPDDAPWGWRTEFDMPSTDELVIRAYVSKPDGTESRATCAEYRRV